MSERTVDRPGFGTPGEDAAWDALRQRITIALRPIGAPTPIGVKEVPTEPGVRTKL